MQEIPLHDIKPIIEIQEYSLYYFVALSGVVLLLLFALGYLAYSYLKNKKSYNIRAVHFGQLQTLSLADPKKAAYAITLYGATFRQDTARHERAYELLVEQLEPYKYKKVVESFDGATQRAFENYLGMIDV